ncbi:MAG: alkaline phosphatase family protein, partial [bacterium]|nr:alkaline phosphatase family protein [bacterium]
MKPRPMTSLAIEAAALTLLAMSVWVTPDAPGAQQKPTVLVIVLDGLRPDYVTPGLMPHTHALAQEGVWCERHHAVFPTVTRVNSASVATGSYPATHGLMGNTVYFPEVDPTRGLSTSKAKNLFRIDKAVDGRLLTTESLGEVLQRHGHRLLAVSSGSQGSSMLLNHKATGGGVINTDLVLPELIEPEVAAMLGPVPEDAAPNAGRNRWAVDAYLKYGLQKAKPHATLMWLSDPDHTAHEAGIGSPRTNKSIRLVDAEVGRILAAHRDANMTVNVMVMSDHGFTTRAGGGANVTKLLIEAGLKEGTNSEDVVLVNGAIYVNDGGDERIEQIVRLFQEQPWAGPIFTRSSKPGAPEGFVSGTLSLDAIHWSHERSADILLDARWTHDANEYGFKGSALLSGVAGHGTSSPYDIHNTLIASGPAFKQSVKNHVPTGNVDIAPTICRLLGIEPPESMDGRVLREMLAEGPAPDSVRVDQRQHRVSSEGDGRA